MAQEKKSKVDDVIKLRKILDNSLDPNIKKLISADETALESVRRRLAGDTSKPKLHYDPYPRPFNSLEPRITIRPNISLSPRLIPPLPKNSLSNTLPEFKSISASVDLKKFSSAELQFTAEDLYEIEKIDANSSDSTDDSNLPEWQPIEEIQQEGSLKTFTKSEVNQISDDKPNEISTTTENTENIVDWESIPPKEESTEELVQFTAVESLESEPETIFKKQERNEKKIQKIKQKEEKRLKKLELKKIKREARDKDQQAKQIITENQDIRQIPEKTEFIPIKQKIITKKLKKKPEDFVEWESYTVEKTIKKPSQKLICTYKDYILYEKETSKHKGGIKKTIRFFSKERPDNTSPIPLPNGYQIKLNKKTRIPYLKKKK